jgi:hypothetical protein
MSRQGMAHIFRGGRMSTELAKQKPPAVVNGVVRFTALMGGRINQEFEVSADVLVEHFGAASRSDDDLLEAFRKGRAEILEVAAQSANTPVNGTVALGTGDFSELNPGKPGSSS